VTGSALRPSQGLQEIWATDADINARHGEFVEYLHSRGVAPESLGSFAQLAFNMHRHVDPAEWADIMPQIKHVHAKFYDIDENGDEPAIDYPAIVQRVEVLVGREPHSDGVEPGGGSSPDAVTGVLTGFLEEQFDAGEELVHVRQGAG